MMKNPFKNDNHTLLIGGVVLGALAAGAATYLFFTKGGSATRRRLTGRLDKLLGREPTISEPKHPHNYLVHKQRAPKTDREKLLKHEILHEPGAHDHQ